MFGTGRPRRPARGGRAWIAAAIVSWAWAWAGGAGAQDVQSAAVRLDDVVQTVRVNADATVVHESRIEMTALTPQGTIAIGKQHVAFNRDVESLEILEAYTLKADGTRIPVGADGIATQVGALAAGTGQTWPGVEVRQVTYPSVTVGDRIVLHRRTVGHRPQLPGWAAFSDYLTPLLDVTRFRTRIEAPRSLDLNVRVDGLQVQRTTEGDLDVWTVEGAARAAPIEADAADLRATMPRILVSTFREHGQFAQAFASVLREKVVVDDATRELARRITEGRTTDVDKARAVHDWIRTNLRYVAVYLGTGGYVPHDVASILRNRFGDCKDLTLLTITLLKAVDVEAAPALQNLTDDYALPDAPVGFNHVLVYLPGPKRFVDPTATGTPFGSLNRANADKPTVVALDGGAVTIRVPAFAASGDGANAIATRSRWRIDREGNATATIDVSATGHAALVLQGWLQQQPTARRAATIERVLAASRLAGSGTFANPPVDRQRAAQSVRFELASVRGVLADPEAGSVAAHPAPNLPYYVLPHLGNYTVAARRSAMNCTPIRVREDFEVEFDAAYRVLRVPRAIVETHPDGIRFEARYVVDGNRLTGFREVVLDHGRHVCTPQQYAARRPAIERIVRHLRSGVLYEQQP